MIVSFKSTDVHPTINYGSISQDHQKAVCYCLFAEGCCFFIVIKKKNPFALLVLFLSKEEMPHQNWQIKAILIELLYGSPITKEFLPETFQK